MAMNTERVRPLSAPCGIWLISFFFTGWAAAQQGLVLPKAQTLSAGVVDTLPSVLSMDVSPLSTNSVFEKRIFEILSSAPENERSTRGPHDIALFRNISPSVVLISTPNATGTGSVISDGLILTNWHVVEGVPFVGVLYKPDAVGAKGGPSIVTAQVIKVDQLRD